MDETPLTTATVDVGPHYELSFPKRDLTCWSLIIWRLSKPATVQLTTVLSWEKRPKVNEVFP
jgi:hypothetical protein